MFQKIILIICIAIGVFFRLYQLDSHPGGLFSDEVSIAVNAKTIAENGVDEYGRKFPFGFESVSDFKMPLYIYLTAGVYQLLGPTILTVRFVAASASILSIFLFGYFATILFPKKRHIGYFAMAVLSLCLLHIHFSRIAYETMLSTTFLLLYLIALYQSITKPKNKIWLIVGSLSIILSLWSYYASRFIIPVFTILVLLLCLISKKTERKLIIRNVGVFLGMMVVAFIPTFLGSNVDKRPASYLLSDVKGATLMEKILFKGRSIVASILWIFNLEFLFKKGDVFAYRHGTKENGIYLSIFVIPYLLGLWTLIREFSFKNLSLVYLVMFSLVAVLPSALTSGVPYAPRLLPMLIPLSMLIAYGCYSLVYILNKQKSAFRIGGYTVILLLLVYQLLYFSHVYFVHFKITSLPEFPTAPVLLGNDVKKIRAAEPNTIIYFLGGKSCHNWGHDDLHLWYFADLPNKEMIKWDNVFREKRYLESSPFDAYDSVMQPRFRAANVILNAEEDEISHAPKDTIIIRCGYHLPNIEPVREKIIHIYYIYQTEKQDPFYVMTKKI